ncbi:MAG: PAS domain S-box protein, partial [Okeania sp. SIO3C4]|nr:PAS domain S-box protein [Okeania sp. SIO3C4]
MVEQHPQTELVLPTIAHQTTWQYPKATMLTLIRTAYFQDFVESLVNGVLIFNTNGQVYVANDAAADILGCSCDSLLAMDWQQVFQSMDDTAAIEDMLSKARAKEQQTPSFHTRLRQDGGQIRHLNISASLLIEYDKVFGILVLMTDVTHIVELHEREKEILEERNRLAKERFASLQNLAAAVAH